MRREHKRSCADKVRYAGEGVSERARQRFPHRDALNSYRCTWCGGWHLGHKKVEI